DLLEFSRRRPITLVLPSLYREFSSGALPAILEELRKVRYLDEVVLCLDRANQAQYGRVKKAFSSVANLTVLWNDGPRMKKVYGLLEANDLFPGREGKGRAVWISFGYVLARNRSRVIALHDCDIVNYDRLLLGRLCYPVANPHSEYEFCKGYYSRVTDRMHGRVTRLFFTPFIRSLQKMLGHQPFLAYMDSFRYALSGEMALRRDLAMAMRIPGDWGLEVGTLAEVYRNMSLNRICQVDIADSYEHKHQELIPGDAEKGLLKMSVDIAKSIFRTLAGEGIQFSEGFFKTLSNIYLKIAQETIVRYQNDAEINGLAFDRHSEAVAVESFTEAIRIAGQAFWQNPFETSLIPSWHRVTAALPEFFDILLEAVERPE
ncbi:MAG: glycosyl transferase, partial [Candidatus Aminicenantes bacterium]|nr:glycosyl transferase [Candidatus Aminicenantes bacterium]